VSGRRNDRKGQKEIPGQNNYPGMPFFIPVAMLPIREERDTLFCRRAGLLASGSSYLPSFPSMLTVAIRLSSPVTAAGPQRIYTVFPLIPEGTTHSLQTAPTLEQQPSSHWLVKSIKTCKIS
jgi:hypothetical protein